MVIHTHFLKRVVGEEEKLICNACLHWIYVLTGLVWLFLCAAGGYVADLFLWQHFGSQAPDHQIKIFMLVFGSRYPWIFWMMTALGVVIALIHILKVVATEIALTDQRLVFKKGLLFVDVQEIDLAEIRAENINHGMLGRFLYYGEVHLDSRFVGDIYLPALSKPHQFLRELHRARRKLVDPIYR